jgi:hypothetical protein
LDVDARMIGQHRVKHWALPLSAATTLITICHTTQTKCSTNASFELLVVQHQGVLVCGERLSNTGAQTAKPMYCGSAFRKFAGLASKGLL